MLKNLSNPKYNNSAKSTFSFKIDELMQFKTIVVTQRSCMITFKSVSGTIF